MAIRFRKMLDHIQYYNIYNMSDLSMQLLNELSAPFCLTHRLSPFSFITCPVLKHFDLSFAIFVHKKV